MFVNFVVLVFSLVICLATDASAQFSFEFMQAPITDTVKFNEKYDYVVVGAGSGVSAIVCFASKIC